MKLRIILFVILVLLLTQIVYCQIDTNKEIKIQQSANFLNDYSGYLEHPPKYVIYDEEVKDISEIYSLFIQYLSGSDSDVKELKINKRTIKTNKKCKKNTKDILSAVNKLQAYFEEKNEFPLAIKIDDCYISNLDFLYLVSRMISDEYQLGSLKKEYLIKKTYFDNVIEFKAQKPKQKEYITFTMDYESDRPVFSDKYLSDKRIISKDVKSIGINPKQFKPICYDNYCTLPKDYKTKDYTSYEVAWYTPIMKNNEIFYPDCYPYCGTLLATDILLDEFVGKYGFSNTWHMTGASIIAIASNPDLLEKVKKYEEQGLLDLGLHTMYHTNIGKVSSEFREYTLGENYYVFKHVFKREPIQFRAPYLSLPDNYNIKTIPENILIKADNELNTMPIMNCNNINGCNYIISDNDISFVEVDWIENDKDVLWNIYLSHPWELLYVTKGDPIYLEESAQAKINIFKSWLYLVGEYGRIPTTPRRYLHLK